MKATLEWLANPEIFAVNRIPAHSDHRYFTSEGKLRQYLNGTWKFAYTEHPDNRRHKDLALRLYRHLQKSIHAGHHADIQILRAIAQFFGGVLLKNAYQQRMKLSHLLFQLFDVASGRNRRHLYVALLPDNI